MGDTTQVWTSEELRRRTDDLALGHVVTSAFLNRVYDAMLVMSMEAQVRHTALQQPRADGSQWVPLEPGAHEHSQGTAYIDENYIPSFGWSVSLRQLMEGGPVARPFEFRLCRLTPTPPPDA